MYGLGPPTSPKKRDEYKSLARDTRVQRRIPTPIYNVKDKTAFGISADEHRTESRPKPLPSPALVEIQQQPVAEPTPHSHLDAIHAAQRACVGASPVTPKKKELYKSLGHGARPLSGRERRIMEEEGNSPMHRRMSPQSSGPASPSSRRTTLPSSRASSYSGARIDNASDEQYLLIDYPHYQAGKATIASAKGSSIHYLPQVFDLPQTRDPTQRRRMILFTEDGSCIDLYAKDCSITSELILRPGDLAQPNPYAITLELYYPGLPSNFHQIRMYQFMNRKKHHQNLFRTVQSMIDKLIQDMMSSETRMKAGLEAWDPAKIKNDRAFRLLGLKHLTDNRYLVAIGVSSKYIRFD